MVKSYSFIFRALLIFLSLVFIMAAVYRIVYYADSAQEMASLNLPQWVSILVIILEFSIALTLLFNKFVKMSSLIASIFLIIAILLGIVTNAKYVFSNVWELFVFNANPTDIFLHMTFLFMLILVYFASIKKK